MPTILCFVVASISSRTSTASSESISETIFAALSIGSSFRYGSASSKYAKISATRSTPISG